MLNAGTLLIPFFFFEERQLSGTDILWLKYCFSIFRAIFPLSLLTFFSLCADSHRACCLQCRVLPAELRHWPCPSKANVPDPSSALPPAGICGQLTHPWECLCTALCSQLLCGLTDPWVHAGNQSQLIMCCFVLLLPSQALENRW